MSTTDISEDRTDIDSTDRCATCSARDRSAFSGLDTEDLERMDVIRNLVHIGAGTEFSTTVERQDGYYCLRSGLVTVGTTYKSMTLLAGVCGTGDLLVAGKSTDGIERKLVAVSNIVACFLSKSTAELQTDSPGAIGPAVIGKLCTMVADRDHRIAKLQKHSVVNRIASILLELLEKNGADKNLSSMIDARIDRVTLAELAGTVPETLSRTLTMMERDRLILRDGHRIRILDTAGLRKIADS